MGQRPVVAVGKHLCGGATGKQASVCIVVENINMKYISIYTVLHKIKQLIIVPIFISFSTDLALRCVTNTLKLRGSEEHPQQPEQKKMRTEDNPSQR